MFPQLFCLKFSLKLVNCLKSDGLCNKTNGSGFPERSVWGNIRPTTKFEDGPFITNGAIRD